MKVVIQTRECISGEYKGLIAEKIFPCENDTEVKIYSEIKQTVEDGNVFKITEVKIINDFNVLEYVKTSPSFKFR